MVCYLERFVTLGSWPNVLALAQMGRVWHFLVRENSDAPSVASSALVVRPSCGFSLAMEKVVGSGRNLECPAEIL
jgi:hypothetical protein